MNLLSKNGQFYAVSGSLLSATPTMSSPVTANGSIITEGSGTETWVFNNTVSSGITCNINFTSNSTQFTSLRRRNAIMEYDNTEVYNDMETGWVNTAYKTIILSEPASGDFLTWLQSNATKQSSVGKVIIVNPS